MLLRRRAGGAILTKQLALEFRLPSTAESVLPSMSDSVTLGGAATLANNSVYNPFAHLFVSNNKTDDGSTVKIR